MGASQLWVLRVHIWPKVRPNVAVQAAQTMGAALLAVAALSFLGLGVVAPTPTWGGVLAADLSFLYQQPWAPLFPGLLLMLTVGAMNILADCISDASGIQRRRKRSDVVNPLSPDLAVEPSPAAIPELVDAMGRSHGSVA
jgi:peptide/nickel transport system permease protein